MSELAPLGVRIGDDERHAVDERLRDAVGAGQLSLTEYETRVVALWTATTSAELQVLVRDLAPAPLPPAPRPGRKALGVAAAVVAAGTAGVIAVIASGPPGQGSDRGSIGDRTVVIGPGQTTVILPHGVGDLTVVLPAGTRADVSGISTIGAVSCELACSRPATSTVRLVLDQHVGGVRVLTEAERRG